MPNEEQPSADPSVVDDIIYYYTLKKRETYSKYAFVNNEGALKDIRAAAIMCTANGLTPDRFVSIAYENFGGKKQFFNTSYLQGPKMQALLKFEKNRVEYKTDVELTRDVMDFADVWKQQIELANSYISHGDSIEEVLLDPTLKFYGWFRILATPEPLPKVIQKYREVARKELAPRLKQYLTSQNFDLDRIL
jgi:hypothetical protein